MKKKAGVPRMGKGLFTSKGQSEFTASALLICWVVFLLEVLSCYVEPNVPKGSALVLLLGFAILFFFLRLWDRGERW